MCDVTDCLYLGEATGQRVQVVCPKRGGPETSEIHQCLHPERERAGGRPGVCLPNWAGPWRQDQRSEARCFALCGRCELRR